MITCVVLHFSGSGPPDTILSTVHEAPATPDSFVPPECFMFFLSAWDTFTHDTMRFLHFILSVQWPV